MIAFAAPPAAVSTAAVAPAPVTVVRPAARVFPFLDLYYRLSADSRTRFTVAYRWRAIAPGGAGAWIPVSATLAEPGGAEVVIPHSPLGWFERVPGPEELAARTVVRLERPAGWRLSMILAPQLVARLGPEMAPAEITAAADQFERGIHAAGPLSVAIPHFRRVLFVGAQGGRLVDDAGRIVAIAPVRGELFASVASLRAAAVLRFDVPPERVLLLPY